VISLSTNGFRASIGFGTRLALYRANTTKLKKSKHQGLLISEARRYVSGVWIEEEPMQQQKVIRTTLGELIVAVTDEVMPFVRDPGDLYIAASCVLDDILAHNQLHLHKRSRRKYPSYLGKA
jgi:selenophosphate synthase